MQEYIAINTVHICRRPAEISETGRVVRKPEIEVVHAGSTFTADQKIVDELVALGGARPKNEVDDIVAQLAAKGVTIDPSQVDLYRPSQPAGRR